MKNRDNLDIVSPFRQKGYALLPEPRSVEFRKGDILLDSSWSIVNSCKQDTITLQDLQSRLRQDFDLEFPEKTDKTIELSVRKGAVGTGFDDPRNDQAYLLDISETNITITGNTLAGLYYGTRTLLQLCQGNGRKRLLLPQCRIEDWPSYELRIVHWDTKHHQDRIETLKRYLDWCGNFKINGVDFELEDKFEYPSHPVIGNPQAFTTEEMQEIVSYAQERFVETIPNIQAPAHLCYVLKHKEFAHLKCDESNYQICMDKPEARKLLFDMYNDVVEATPGCSYVHVSTDEVYYAGICEEFRKPYNPENRSLTWVDYVNAAHEYITGLGRRVIVWAEYPLLAEHVKLLSPDIIDGVIGNEDILKEEQKIGMRQFAYCPAQGAEKLFPNYFGYTEKNGTWKQGRLHEIHDASFRGKATRGNPIGAFVAAWGDSGLHNETFWLGWTAMAEASWVPGRKSPQQCAQDFMDIYYGFEAQDMADVYATLQQGARFWEYTWEHILSKERGPAYGSSDGKRPVNRMDMCLTPPSLPELPDLKIKPMFSGKYGERFQQAHTMLKHNERAIGRLYENIPKARYNSYNLEVLLSIAFFQNHFIQMIIILGQAEEILVQAGAAAQEGNHEQALSKMTDARNSVNKCVEDLYKTFGRLEKTWEKSQLPRNASKNGKDFVHVMDDVKNHFADRRKDLTYMIAPFERIGLPEWVKSLEEIITSYSELHGLGVHLTERYEPEVDMG